jgi:hypothetical protein
MVSHLFYYQLAVLILAWLFVMLHVTGSKPGLPAPPISAQPKRKRSTAPKPFAGLTHRPHCALCERETEPPNPPVPVPPDPLPPTNRRPRTVDTSRHFCPHTDCAYRGWLGLNNLRANGHPSGGPWRQFHCTACDGYFPEHHGTIFHGKQAAVELIVHVLACLAEDFLPFVNPNLSHFFTPSARPAHNESGLHHSTYDDATWPSGYAAAGPQYCVRLAHAAGLWPAEPHTRR